MSRRTVPVAILSAIRIALAPTGAASHTPVKAEAPIVSPRPDEILVHCRVFHDQNADGVRQAGEPGLPDVGIQNGVTTLYTDSQGDLDVRVDRNLYRFATLRIPAGYWPTTPWYRWVPVGMLAPVTVEFGLKTDPRSATDPVRWVHISDTQVLSWGTNIDIRPDLQAINELSDPPLFLVNTGDLVEVGSDTTHWNNYVTQIATSALPVFNVPGNHDTLGTATPLANYEKYVGPPYYDMDVGSWRFIFYNAEAAAIGTPAQDQWLDEIFTTVPLGRPLALFQHRMLAEINQNKVYSWAQRGLHVAFSGHWHSHSFSRHPFGILDYNLSRTSVGPLDRTPRSFGIVTCAADGSVSYELRRLGVDHRSNLACPRPNGAYSGSALDVLVQAYDTSSPVRSLTAVLSGIPGSLPPIALYQEGVSLWRGTLDVGALPAGCYDVNVAGSFEDGRSIGLQSTFQLTGGPSPTHAPGADWPMFRKCAAGSSFTATPLEPPLELAWSTPLPGMVELNSPVVASGKVYIGCRSESGDMNDAGVLCCDAATGAAQWFTPVSGGVALAPAVAGGIVMATAMTDSVFGLDAASGQIVWKAKAPGNNYKMTAPIFEGNRAWVGAEPALMTIDPANGQKVWTSPNLGPAWYSTMYTAPAVNASYVYCGFYGTPGIFPDGFAILNRATGATVFQQNGTFRSAVCAGGTVYLVGGTTVINQVVTARDMLGSVIWSSPKLLDQGSGAPALGHGVLVVGGANGAMEGFRASDGANLWTRSVGPSLYDMSPNRVRVKDTIGTPAIADSVVFLGSSDGNLYALDLASGAELSRTYLGTPIASSPAISGNMLFVGASDGHVYGFVGLGAGAQAFASTSRDGGKASFFALHPPRPNPSAGVVLLEWVVPRKTQVRLDVVDVQGRVVRTLVDGPASAGENFSRWDGRNSEGDEAAAGIYFVRLRADGLSGSRKLVRLRG
jgi:outer membrane protein assembly factor BamB